MEVIGTGTCSVSSVDGRGKSKASVVFFEPGSGLFSNGFCPWWHFFVSRPLSSSNSEKRTFQCRVLRLMIMMCVRRQCYLHHNRGPQCIVRGACDFGDAVAVYVARTWLRVEFDGFFFCATQTPKLTVSGRCLRSPKLGKRIRMC